MEESERIPIEELYPDLKSSFPIFISKLPDFLTRNRRKQANLATSNKDVSLYVNELVSLATILAKEIKTAKIDPVSLYLSTTYPSKYPKNEQTGVGIRTNPYIQYFILDRDNTGQTLNEDGSIPLKDSNLLMLLQRVSHGQDTIPEVHGIKKGKDIYTFTQHGGIEVYIPLTDNIEFSVNEKVYNPQALDGLITILPGDIHHHIKVRGQGPARVLILGGFGFGRGTKVGKEGPFDVRGFGHIPVKKFANIPRFYSSI